MAESSADHPGEPQLPGAFALLERQVLRITELERHFASPNIASLSSWDQLGAKVIREAFLEPPPPLSLQPLSRDPAVSWYRALLPDDGESPGYSGFPAQGPAALNRSLGSRLGSQAFNLEAVTALLSRAARTHELAFEHSLVGLSARVLAGLAVGGGLIVWSEMFRQRAKPRTASSSILKAVGASLLCVSISAVSKIYALLSRPFVLGAMLLVTAWNASVASAQDAEVLAGCALAGVPLTPVLLARSADRETVLFTYLPALIGAVVLLQRIKARLQLLVATFLASVAYSTGYSVRFSHNSRIYSRDSQFGKTAFFVVLFRVLSALPLTGHRQGVEAAGPQQGHLEATRFADLISAWLPSANAAFLALALTSILADKVLAAVSLILFNLVVVVSNEREISALWIQPAPLRLDTDLARPLALFGGQMLYGASLAVAGFWRRNALVRWHALLLLLFTIATVLVSDPWGLSANYRVASFLTLGVLLTISFGYQKALLSLLEPVARSGVPA